MYNADNTLKMRFEYADGRMPVAMTKDGTTYYLAYDQAGTLKAVADASGTVVKRIEYDTFGNVLNESNPAFAVPFGFAGGLYDRDTKLVRFGYRDYDPETGRWTAKDPILFAGGDTDLYGYCLNDPVNLTDSDGLMVIAIPAAALLKAAEAAFGVSATVIIAEWLSDILFNESDEVCDEDTPVPPEYPGDDPTAIPEGFEWKGRPGSKPGDKEGNYHNPETGESLRPDLDHNPPVGPHWDYKDPNGNWHRLYPDGTAVPK